MFQNKMNKMRIVHNKRMMNKMIKNKKIHKNKIKFKKVQEIPILFHKHKMATKSHKHNQNLLNKIKLLNNKRNSNDLMFKKI
jgi:hypothetical protein